MHRARRDLHPHGPSAGRRRQHGVPDTGDAAQLLLDVSVGGTRTTEVPRGRRVGLVELDVAAAGPGTSQRVVRITLGRVHDDLRGAGHDGLGQPDDEHVIATRLAGVLRIHAPVDVTIRVRPRGAADQAATPRLACLGIRGVVPEVEVSRDAGPVNVQAGAVVDVLQVAPGRRAVLASAPYAE